MHPLTTCSPDRAAQVVAAAAVESARASLVSLDTIIAQLTADRAAAQRRLNEAVAALDAINARTN